MKSTMRNTFDEFYKEIEAEAVAEGTDAVRDLRTKELKYALISSLMAGRRALNLTQAQLAERSGVAQAEISRIERGRKSPTMDTYSRLAAALGLRLSLVKPRSSRPRHSGGVAVGSRAAHRPPHAGLSHNPTRCPLVRRFAT